MGDAHRRPHQLARDAVDLADDGAIHLVVVVALVVDLDEENAVRRLVEQRGYLADDARARIAKQATRSAPAMEGVSFYFLI